MNFVFSVDPNYIQHLSVCLHSLWVTNDDLVDNVFIIITSKQTSYDSNFTKGINYLSSIFGDRLNLIYLESSELKEFKPTGPFPIATFSRILIAKLLPNNIDLVVYSDPDIIFNDRLDEISLLNFEGKPDCFAYAVDHGYSSNELTIYPEIFDITLERYFNSGFLIVNLEKWRRDKIHVKAKQIATDFAQDLLWCDQDILNIIFCNNWIELHVRYNYFLEGIIFRNKPVRGKGNYNPVVIHFAGNSKPWHYLNKNPFKDTYYKYLAQTPFKNFKQEGKTIKNFIIKYFVPEATLYFFHDLKPYINKFRSIFTGSVS